MSIGRPSQAMSYFIHSIRLSALRELLRPFYLRRLYFPLFPSRKPPYFDAAWLYPDAEAPADARRPAVIFFPMNDWHARAQRTAHLARALSRQGYPCIYLSPHLGREFPRCPDRSARVRLTQLAPDLYELHVHLPREPVFHHRSLTAPESGILAEAIQGALRFIRARAAVQILAFPVWLDAALAIKRHTGAPIIYDCHDYLPGFSGIAPSIVAREPDLFRLSDGVVCSSENLIRRAQSLLANAPVLIRNAAPAELLITPRRADIPPSPVIIGYIGALDSWFDCEAVRAAALARPDWRFQLVGRVENSAVAQLAALPNIELTGEIPFRLLGDYLSRFTIAVIPFALNSLIDATDPIKVYEYFAAGLPVVASQLPELDRFSHLLWRYQNPSDFVSKLGLALTADSASLQEQRRSVAAAETWEKRAETLIRLIDHLVGAAG